MNQDRTPLYDVLKRHEKKHPISLHVPGHKNGRVFCTMDDPFFRYILNIDVTELTNLDDLHSPEGVILEAEELLAHAYQVDKSFFLVNGSTVGNLAMILATLNEGDTVFIQRNCHKSILNGIEMAKAFPVLLGPEFHESWGVASGVLLETIQRAYEAFPQCKAIIMTYPNYYGMVYDLGRVIQFAHERNIAVLIDEAHGAHFIGGDYFPVSAVELGADIVVQSAHKTLPAMTMGSFLHVRSRLVSYKEINRYLRILQSSSPSYPIMASLDLARNYIATYSKEDQIFLRELITTFKEELNQLSNINVLEYPNGQGDPLKMTIQSNSGLSGYELQNLLEREGVFTEMADPYNVLLVLPLLRKGMDFPFHTIVSRIRKALEGNNKDVAREKKKFTYFQRNKISTLEGIQELEEEVVSISNIVGRIGAENIIPYPPGIPLLLRGEKITEEDQQSLLLLLESGARFQGGQRLKNREMKVFTTFGGYHE